MDEDWVFIKVQKNSEAWNFLQSLIALHQARATRGLKWFCWTSSLRVEEALLRVIQEVNTLPGLLLYLDEHARQHMEKSEDDVS